jgi:O-antigen/teichoic acid export membrane protein
MIKLVRQLAGESVIYGLSGIISRFISLFLVPLYTRILLPSDYGILGLVNTTFFFVGIFVVFALDNSAARWYYDSEDEHERKKTFASWFWFQLSVSILVSAIVILLSSPLSQLILKERLPQLLIIPAITLLANILPAMIWNWLRLQRKAWATVIFNLSNAILTILFNIYFTLILRLGVQGILLAALCSNSLSSLYALWVMKGWIKYAHFSLKRLREMLKYATPLIPTSLAFWVLSSSAVYALQIFRSPAEIGLFQIGSSIAGGVALIVGAFQMAWGPFAFSILNKPEAKDTYSAVLTIYTLVTCSLALLVALFAKEILMVLTTSQYFEAATVAGILAFHAILSGFTYISSIGISIVKKTSPMAVAVMMAALITPVFYFFLIPLLGKEGAALSNLIGYIIVPVILFYKSQKLYKIPYRFPLVFLLFISSIAIYLIYFFLPVYSFQTQLLVKIVLVICYMAISILLLFFYYPERFKSLLLKYKLI